MSDWLPDGWLLAWPWWLLAIPLPLLLALWQRRSRGTPLAQALKVPFASELRVLTQQGRARGTAGSFPWLALLAWAALCVAAARPQQLGEATQPPQTGRDLLLARPDLHVVWRGDQPPADPQRVAAVATGHAS